MIIHDILVLLAVGDNIIDAMSRVISAVQMNDPPLCFSVQHLQNPTWVCVCHGFRRRCLLQAQIVIGSGDKVSHTVDLRKRIGHDFLLDSQDGEGRLHIGMIGPLAFQHIQ